MELGGRDSAGNIFFAGHKNQVAAIWKFNSSGKLLWSRTYPDLGNIRAPFARVTNDHLLVRADEAAKIDAETGDVSWSLPLTNSSRIVVRASNPYAYLTSSSSTQKIDSAGTIHWTANFELIADNGELLGQTGSTLSVYGAQAGEFVRNVPLSPTPVGRLRPVMIDSALYLIDQNKRRYHYRHELTPLNLGPLAVDTQDFPYVTLGQRIFIQTGGKVECRVDWAKQWEVPGRLVDLWDGHLLVSNGNLKWIDIQTGTTNSNFGPNFNDAAVLASQVWALDNDLQSKITRFNVNNANQVLGSWESNTNIQGAAPVLTGVIGPGNDLLLWCANSYDGYLVRVTPAGQLRWSLRVPGAGAFGFISSKPGAGMTISANKRHVSVWTESAVGLRAYEFDPTTVQLLRSFNGYSLSAGNHVYRSGFTTASKYELSTGRELWRIPRSGVLAVGADGSLYVGGTKNRGVDGQRLWSNPNVTSIFPLGNRLGATAHGGFAFLNDANGATLWSDGFFSSSYGSGRADIEVHRAGGFVTVRFPQNPYYVGHFNEATGARVAVDSWGFWDSQERFYRAKGTSLVRYDSFIPDFGLTVAAMDRGAMNFFPDGTGAVYLVDSVGASDSLFMARWTP